MQSRAERKEAEKRKKRARRNNMLFYTIISAVLAGCAIYLAVLASGDDGASEPSGGTIAVTPNPPAVSSAPASPSAPAHEPEPSPSAAHSGAPQAKAVTIHFAGDVMFGARVGDVLAKQGYDYPYQSVRRYLSDADLTIVNLETAVTEAGEEQAKQYVYRSSPQALPALKKSGVDIVNLANNHSMDYGVSGLLDTFRHLDEAGIAYVGAGRNIDEAYAPRIVEKNGVKIAVLGFTRVYEEAWWQASSEPGVAGTYDYRVPRALEAIRQAKSEADLVVVIAHWGVERKETPEPYQTALARRYIDEGADLVVGGHPHVVQGFETYKGKWIAYSLGNFIFTVNPNPLTWNSMILQAACTVQGDCDLTAVPVSAAKVGLPEPMEGEEAKRLLERLSALSPNAKVDADGKVREDRPKPTIVPPPLPTATPHATAPSPTPKPTPSPSVKPSQAAKPSPKPSAAPSTTVVPSGAESPAASSSAPSKPPGSRN
ncbi:CapA family protein [Paenibacillus thermoaerophilus]|uniref:CapA family protein n=1 Tax=Paenibacillus thermoaerophilus TaxID=1215385 RepID=A0ABW2V971_9BACL|nr:CapA family protein [Paenibacillus thermoaerophilus]TMV17868.1 CapA family protein [Paenibacillus thermoaerophilus]